MQRYYTRACNFYFGNQSKILVNKKKSIPLHNIKEISFDHIEIITRKSKKIISYASELGLKLTPAGSTHPYGVDEDDKYIRLAPTACSLEELEAAMEVFSCCVGLTYTQG